MEDTIIALLNSNLRVIIPDFGAFIIRQKQPRVIVFNEFLRYNDGILIDFIVKNEGIDREIAEQRVLDFAEDGTKLLASGRELVIPGLGSLRKDSSGKIGFVEAPETIEIEETTPEEKELIPDKEEIPEYRVKIEGETKKRPKSKSTGKPKSKVKDPAEKSKKTSKPRVRKSITDVPSEVIQPDATDMPAETGPVTALRPEIPDAAVFEPYTLNESKDTLDLQSAGSFRESPAEKRTADGKDPEIDGRPVSFSTNRILTWALIILFLNAGILAWFVFKNKIRGNREIKSATTMITDSLYDQLADSVMAAAMDTGIVYSEVPGETEFTGAGSLTGDSRYYIVAGCFRDEVNADSLVASLRMLGYKAEKFGKIGNLFAVCYASFNNKEDAVPELKRIRETVPSAWMTKF